MAEKEEKEEERTAEEEEEEGGRRELGKKEEEETEDHSSISVSVLRAARREGSWGTEGRRTRPYTTTVTGTKRTNREKRILKKNSVWCVEISALQ